MSVTIHADRWQDSVWQALNNSGDKVRVRCTHHAKVITLLGIQISHRGAFQLWQCLTGSYNETPEYQGASENKGILSTMGEDIRISPLRGQLVTETLPREVVWHQA